MHTYYARRHSSWRWMLLALLKTRDGCRLSLCERPFRSRNLFIAVAFPNLCPSIRISKRAEYDSPHFRSDGIIGIAMECVKCTAARCSIESKQGSFRYYREGNLWYLPEVESPLVRLFWVPRSALDGPLASCRNYAVK